MARMFNPPHPDLELRDDVLPDLKRLSAHIWHAKNPPPGETGSDQHACFSRAVTTDAPCRLSA